MNIKKIPKEFDWEFYVSNNRDLQKANINTKSKAMSHYIAYGKKEERIYSRKQLIGKYAKRNISLYDIKHHIMGDFVDLLNMGHQLYVSASLKHLEDRIKRTYNVKKYIDFDSPCIFFGLYDKNDHDAIHRHRSDIYLMPGGSDVPNYISYIMSNEYKILAISEDIKHRLKKSNIESELINFNIVDRELFRPVYHKGVKIFIYDGIREKSDNADVYGKQYYDKVVKLLPEYEFIYSSKLGVPYEKMPDIYAQCFIGLRLTEHDGNANMVQEMETMNIPVVHNHSKYGLKWKNVDDIIDHIYSHDSIDFYNSHVSDDILKHVYSNIDRFTKLIKNYKNLLFICGDYPGYGGAATNCDRLQKFYKKKGHMTYTIYYNYENDANAKYENNTDYCIIESDKIVHTILNINFKPDVVILKSFIGGINLKNIINCPVFYLIGGIYKNSLDKYYYDIDINEREKYINQFVVEQIRNSDYSFCNSGHTQSILRKYYNINTKIFYSSFIQFYGQKIADDPYFDDREYTYGLIVSNFNRHIKNISESIDFLKNKKKVILIGKNSSIYESYGFKCIELINNDVMEGYYKQIKYIVQDSFYESCSNVKIESQYYGCKPKPVIVVSSTQYPGYGGSATNAYNIIKYLRKNKFKTVGVFFHINIDTHINYDPDKLNGIFLYNINGFEKKHVYRDCDNYLKSRPTLCIAKNYIAPLLCKNIFECYTVYLVSGINHFSSFYKEKTAHEILEPKYKIAENDIIPDEIQCNKTCNLIVFNSKLCMNLFEKIYPSVIPKIYKTILDTSQVSDETYPSEKTYDILLCCSRLDRIDKNNTFLINILNNKIFDKYSKIIIGANNDKFINIANSKCVGLLDNRKCIKYMSKCKLLLFPSKFDANPNTVREAYYNGCLSLITKNVGHYELYPQYLVCESFDENEWISKILYILENYDIIRNNKINYHNNMENMVELIECKSSHNDHIGKEDIVRFYQKFPHFNHTKYISDNSGFTNEHDCIRYILNNIDNIEVLQDAYIQRHEIKKYYNIYLGFCINDDISTLKNTEYFDITRLSNENLKIYDDKYTYIIIDNLNINNDINTHYRDKIILYINSSIGDSNILKLIEKYNIQYFILDPICDQRQLREIILDYKLIFESEDFETCLYEIYNYKKKYIKFENVITANNSYENFENFDEVIDIDISIKVKSENNQITVIINDTTYIRNIEPNILNTLHIEILNIDKIKIKIKNVRYIIVKHRKINEKIQQLYLTENLYKYKGDNRIHIAHQLKNYYDINKPAFFYGIVKPADIDIIMNHRGKKYIIFSGGDIDLLYHINKNTNYTQTRWNYMKMLQNLDEIYYIPRSSFMINDMKSMMYKYTYVPFFTNTFREYQLRPKGEYIYIYTYPDYQKYLYGNVIIEKIKKLKPEYKFLNLTHNKTYYDNKQYCDDHNISTIENYDELIKKYQECFVSIRLTNHDGIANSVLEMGMLGIKTIYNDNNCPAGLSYTNINDIIDHIETEKHKIGTIDNDVVKKIRFHVTPNPEIYHSDYYEKNDTRVILCSGDHPYYGGAATNMYALTKFFNSKNNVRAIGVIGNSDFLTNDQLDHDNIGCIYHIRNYSDINIKYDIIRLLGGAPDVIYAKKYIVGYNLKKLFPDCKIIYILSSVIASEYNDADRNRPEIDMIPQCIKELTFTDKIICNSKKSKNILLNYNKNADVKVAYTSLIINDGKYYNFINLNESSNMLNNWNFRKYDIAFVSSCCNRKIKNIELFLKIISHDNFRIKNKLIIGNNSCQYSYMENCVCTGLLKHNALINMLKNIKLVIITSYYDSLPNIMLESLNNGCNVLINDNIGGTEFLNDMCIAHSYDEYIEKTNYLINNNINCIKNRFNYTESNLYDDLYYIN